MEKGVTSILAANFTHRYTRRAYLDNYLDSCPIAFAL